MLQSSNVNPSAFEEVYTMHDELGRGAFSVVFLAVKNDTQVSHHPFKTGLLAVGCRRGGCRCFSQDNVRKEGPSRIPDTPV